LVNNSIRKKENLVMKAVPSDKKKSLGKLPKNVRNRMGYMNEGGMAPPKFKTCAGCPTPAKCTAAGKCAKKSSGMAKGGMSSKKKDYMAMGMSKGGMTSKKGYNKGGYCGASNPAERPMKKSS
jgi:hypothetical protein